VQRMTEPGISGQSVVSRRVVEGKSRRSRVVVEILWVTSRNRDMRACCRRLWVSFASRA
jgi:hypothetical protein